VSLQATGEYPVPYQLGNIPSGEAGTAATLRLMVGLVTQYRASPLVRVTAQRLVSDCPSRDALCQVKALHAFVRDRIKYLPDVRNVETLQTPDYTLQEGSGDCDDHATTLCCLLEAIGKQTRFAAIAVRNGQFSHVSGQVLLGTRWLNLETIVPKLKEPWGIYPMETPTPVGWFPQDATKVMLARVP